LKAEVWTYKIIGAAMEVHNGLGTGFLEGVYQEALQIEFQLKGIRFKAQEELTITYKSNQLKTRYKPDFVVEDKIVVELKALPVITGIEEAQLLNYLRATGMETGLLIDFGSTSLEWKRMVL
jgi:GxxExxY protein